jgi:hypothetical protein
MSASADDMSRGFDVSGFDPDLLREVVGDDPVDDEPAATSEENDDAAPESEPVQEAGEEEQVPAREAVSPETVSKADYDALQQELTAQRERAERTNARLDMVLEKMNAPEPTPEPEPKPDPRLVNEIDPEEDPLGHMRRENEILRARLDDTEKSVADTRKAAGEQDQQREFMQALVVHEANARKQHADYEQAIDYLRNQERGRLNFQLNKMIQAGQVQKMDDAAKSTLVEQQLRRMELQAAHHYAEQGLDPALSMYEYAEASGYTPKQAETPAAPADDDSPEAKKLREKAALQAETQTLGSGADMTRDTITDGDDAEFMAAFNSRFK